MSIWWSVTGSMNDTSSTSSRCACFKRLRNSVNRLMHLMGPILPFAFKGNPSNACNVNASRNKVAATPVGAAAAHANERAIASANLVFPAPGGPCTNRTNGSKSVDPDMALAERRLCQLSTREYTTFCLELRLFRISHCTPPVAGADAWFASVPSPTPPWLAETSLSGAVMLSKTRFVSVVGCAMLSHCGVIAVCVRVSSCVKDSDWGVKACNLLINASN